VNGKIENKHPVDSLKHKFSSLHNNKKPTGDHNCPPEVRRAKRLWRMIQSEMGFSGGEQIINNPLNDSEEDVAIEGEEDEESGATTTVFVGPEVVTRMTKNRVNREHVEATERGRETAVNCDTTRNAGVGGVGGGVHSPILPLNIFQIRMPRARNKNSNATTSSVSEVMQFMLMRAETDAQQ
jgi:hypothetical protein